MSRLSPGCPGYTVKRMRALAAERRLRNYSRLQRVPLCDLLRRAEEEAERGGREAPAAPVPRVRPPAVRKSTPAEIARELIDLFSKSEGLLNPGDIKGGYGAFVERVEVELDPVAEGARNWKDVGIWPELAGFIEDWRKTAEELPQLLAKLESIVRDNPELFAERW